MEPILSYVSAKIPLGSCGERAGFSPAPLSWHNSAAELILVKLSKKPPVETRHLIFHPERNLLPKGDLLWEGEQGAG